jgi:hypothetical protein
MNWFWIWLSKTVLKRYNNSICLRIWVKMNFLVSSRLKNMKKWNFIEIKLTLTKLKCERKQEKGKIKRKS